MQTIKTGRLASELFLPTRVLASGNRCLVKNAHPILECKHSSDRLVSSSLIPTKKTESIDSVFFVGARDGKVRIAN